MPKLVREGRDDPGDEVQKMNVDDFRQSLEQEFEAARNSYKPNKADWLDGVVGADPAATTDRYARRGRTGVDRSQASQAKIGQQADRDAGWLQPSHRTLKRVIGNRRKMIEEGEGIDWAMAEHLAFATLLCGGLSGAPVGPGFASAAPSRSVIPC